jgi:putative transposase
MEYNISAIRSSIKGPVARNAIQYLEEQSSDWLLKISRQRNGKIERLFWQTGGGYDRNITSGKAILSMFDYIHMNPVRKGLVTQAHEWKWSSASWYINHQPGPFELNPIPPEWLKD